MQIFTELNYNPNLSLALGYFDGVHLAHQSVIMQAVDFARANNSKSAIITFSDHPCCTIWGVCPKYILTRENRREQIASLGVDFLYEIDFCDVKNMNAQDYLQNVLIKNFEPVAISTGYNHNFGHNKSGDVSFLRESSQIYNYEYFEQDAQRYNDEIISSSVIRRILSVGEIEKANNMLNKKFSITNIIKKGNQIGRTIGYKTANIEYPNELINIPFGVYQVDTNYGKGIANFGSRPTVDGENIVFEVHILNFDKDIYGEILVVEFEKMIRAERKFASLDELKSQIEIDLNSVV
ncbi:MAG: riboflavin biosynthesis protein RibF [Candidatus Gastranaerophilales bacterium]